MKSNPGGKRKKERLNDMNLAGTWAELITLVITIFGAAYGLVKWLGRNRKHKPTAKTVLEKCHSMCFEQKEYDENTAVFRMHLTRGEWSRDLVLDVLPRQGRIKFNIRNRNRVDDKSQDAIAPLCEHLGFSMRKRSFELVRQISSSKNLFLIVNVVLQQLAEKKDQLITRMIRSGE